MEIPNALHTLEMGHRQLENTLETQWNVPRRGIIIWTLTPIDGHIVLFVQKPFQLLGIDILDDGLYFLLVIGSARFDGRFLLAVGGRGNLMGRRH